MSRAVQTRRLADHIASLETMTRFVLATLALGSGVYTYLGVRSLLDGSATVVFFAAVIYSVSVSVAMYGFWTYLIRFLPEMRDGGSRLCAGRHHGRSARDDRGHVVLAERRGTRRIGRCRAASRRHAGGLYRATSTRPTATRSARFRCCPTSSAPPNASRRLAADEQNSGALTGTSGSGSVVQLLSQMSAQMNELEPRSRRRARPCRRGFAEGQAHLATMRALVSAPGPDRPALRRICRRGGQARRRRRRARADVDCIIGDAGGGGPFRRLHRSHRRRRLGRPRRTAGPGHGDHSHLGRRAVQGLVGSRRRDPRRSPRCPSGAMCR